MSQTSFFGKCKHGSHKRKNNNFRNLHVLWFTEILNVCIHLCDRFPHRVLWYTAILEVIRFPPLYKISLFMPEIRAGLSHSVSENGVCLQAWAAQRSFIGRMGQRRWTAPRICSITHPKYTYCSCMFIYMHIKCASVTLVMPSNIWLYVWASCLRICQKQR